jgi:hypothetical protein
MAEEVVPPAGETTQVIPVSPWPDMANRPVLHVAGITDLKALLTVQSLLRKSGGAHSIRLLGVNSSDAWFVADSLPTGGWSALVGADPRLRQQEGVPVNEDAPLHASVIWDAEAVADDLPSVSSASPSLP